MLKKWGYFYYSHFEDEKTEACDATWPKFTQLVNSGISFKPPNIDLLQIFPLNHSAKTQSPWWLLPNWRIIEVDRLKLGLSGFLLYNLMAVKTWANNIINSHLSYLICDRKWETIENNNPFWCILKSQCNRYLHGTLCIKSNISQTFACPASPCHLPLIFKCIIC